MKTCHPDVGGASEDMVDLNVAKNFMDGLFAGNKNAIYTCAPVANAADNVAYDAGKDAWPGEPPEGFAEAVNAARNQSDRAGRGERVRSAYREKHGSGVSKGTVGEDKVGGANGKTATETSHRTNNKATTESGGKAAAESAAEADSSAAVREKRPDPIWYKIGNWIVDRFPWRLTLFIISFGCFLRYMSDTSIPMTSEATMGWVLFAALGLANLVTGIVTTPVRKLIRIALDTVLRMAK